MTKTIELNERELHLIQDALLKYGSDKSENVKAEVLRLLASIGKQQRPKLDHGVNIVGTGYQARISATRSDIESVFGAAPYGPTIDGKVNFSWHFRLPSGRPATLYDWKNSIPKDHPEQVIHWHIGAKSLTDGQELATWLAEVIPLAVAL